MRKLDLTNKRVGRLLVLHESEKSKRGQIIWHCKCDCGNEKDVRACHLQSGKINSCGCLLSDILVKRNKSHEMCGTRFYNMWCWMKSRCLNINDTGYHLYGGRGITVCDRWKSFENFKEDMYPSYLDHAEEFGEKNTSIDRIDPNGNYEPNNCRWATREEQSLNKRRTIKVEFNGEYLTLKQISSILGVSYNKLYGRIRRGRDIYGNKV